jgi:ABC-type oligopeptide transport system ATPase subunit
VDHVAERMIVLNRGNIIGLGPINGVLEDPIHPYLRALAASRFDTVGA